jgi:hypothetical protein
VGCAGGGLAKAARYAHEVDVDALTALPASVRRMLVERERAPGFERQSSAVPGKLDTGAQGDRRRLISGKRPLERADGRPSIELAAAKRLSHETMKRARP